MFLDIRVNGGHDVCVSGKCDYTELHDIMRAINIGVRRFVVCVETIRAISAESFIFW
jgi:hypothetical protein